MSFQLNENTKVLCKEDKLIIPVSLQHRAVSWYHHYLQHPGHSRLEELLVIAETLKEFKGMLWGQPIKVFTDHKNLMRDALGLTLDRVYQWRFLLEEFGPKIVYIKGIHNTIEDAISRHEYDPSVT